MDEEMRAGQRVDEAERIPAPKLLLRVGEIEIRPKSGGV
jgi:hypothetical protein